jgi:hypothetical protein
MTPGVSMLCALNSFMMSRNCHRTRARARTRDFVNQPECARARRAHESVHYNGAGRDAAPACGACAIETRRASASAYLVVDLRLLLELHLDLVQIREGVLNLELTVRLRLSRRAAGCHGHVATRERALRLVLDWRVGHRHTAAIRLLATHHAWIRSAWHGARPARGTLSSGLLHGGHSGGGWELAHWHWRPRIALRRRDSSVRRRG